MNVSRALVVFALRVPLPAVRQPSSLSGVLRHISRSPIGVTLVTSALTLPVALAQVKTRSVPSGLSAASSRTAANVIVAVGAGAAEADASADGDSSVGSADSLSGSVGSSVGDSLSMSVGSSVTSATSVGAAVGVSRLPVSNAPAANPPAMASTATRAMTTRRERFSMRRMVGASAHRVARTFGWVRVVRGGQVRPGLRPRAAPRPRRRRVREALDDLRVGQRQQDRAGRDDLPAPAPPPSTIRSRSMTAASIHTGSSAGSPNTVTPPISWPVIARVSSADANDDLRPKRPFTARLTSSRWVASTTHAAYTGSAPLPTTMIVFAESSSANP